jgi:hypothetical protein
VVHELVVGCRHPEGPAARHAGYRTERTPRALRQPGPLQLTAGRARSLDPSQTVPCLVAEVDCESERAMVGSSSTTGRAAADDLADFTAGGLTSAHVEVHEGRQK